MPVTFEDVIENEGTLVYSSKGISMLPLIRQGKCVVVIEKITGELKKNDVVLFKRGKSTKQSYVLHRIRRINKDGKYFIIGDNCIGGDIVSREDIIGILTEIKYPKKTININSAACKIFTFLWYGIYPLRYCYKTAKMFAVRCLRYIARKVRKLCKKNKK